jgi:hypothetical protein
MDHQEVFKLVKAALLDNRVTFSLLQSLTLASMFNHCLQVIQIMTGPGYGLGILLALCLHSHIGVFPSFLLAVPSSSRHHGCETSVFTLVRRGDTNCCH